MTEAGSLQTRLTCTCAPCWPLKPRERRLPHARLEEGGNRPRPLPRALAFLWWCWEDMCSSMKGIRLTAPQYRSPWGGTNAIPHATRLPPQPRHCRSTEKLKFKSRRPVRYPGPGTGSPMEATGTLRVSLKCLTTGLSTGCPEDYPIWSCHDCPA